MKVEQTKISRNQLMQLYDFSKSTVLKLEKLKVYSLELERELNKTRGKLGKLGGEERGGRRGTRKRGAC